MSSEEKICTADADTFSLLVYLSYEFNFQLLGSLMLQSLSAKLSCLETGRERSAPSRVVKVNSK